MATLLSDKTAAADVIKLLSETDIGNGGGQQARSSRRTRTST